MLEVRIVHLDADVLTARERGGRACASTSSEGIEYGLALKSGGTDQRQQRRYRLSAWGVVCCRCMASPSHRRAAALAAAVCPWPAEMPAHADSGGTCSSSYISCERRCVRPVENPRYAMLRRTHRSSSIRRT